MAIFHQLSTADDARTPSVEFVDRFSDSVRYSDCWRFDPFRFVLNRRTAEDSVQKVTLIG
jgi:hypothetical protein